jgi:S1-C subfamily serine protease
MNVKIMLIGALFLGGAAVAGFMMLSNSTPPHDNIPTVDADTPPEKLAEAAKKNTQEPAETKVEPHRPIEELVRQSLPSVAIVKGKVGHGTGFLLPQNIVATNAHVVGLEFEANIRVWFPSAAKEKRGPYTAKFLWADRKRDVAFLEVNCDIEPLELADDYVLKPGEEVIAIGSPGLGNDEMLPNAPTRGLMSNTTKLNGQQFYALSISVNPGNSGGPVIDMKGRVLGMITAKMRDKDGIAFAIPLEDLHRGYEQEVLTQSRATGPWMESWLRACTVFERLIYLGNEYISVLDTYAQAMTAATVRGGTPNDGLRDASKETDGRLKMVSKVLADALEKNVVAVIADPYIMELDRARISELWKCCHEMKTMIDQPRGTIESYRNRKEQLKRRYLELTGLIERVQKPAH